MQNIDNSQGIETTCPSDRGLNQEAVICPHNGKLFSHKKENFFPFIAKWKAFQGIMCSKASENDKDKYWTEPMIWQSKLADTDEVRLLKLRWGWGSKKGSKG